MSTHLAVLVFTALGSGRARSASEDGNHIARSEVGGRVAPLQHDAPHRRRHWVMCPDANVLVTGDVYGSRSYPSLDWGSGGSICGMILALETFLRAANDTTKIVPGVTCSHHALAASRRRIGSVPVLRRLLARSRTTMKRTSPPGKRRGHANVPRPDRNSKRISGPTGASLAPAAATGPRPACKLTSTTCAAPAPNACAPMALNSALRSSSTPDRFTFFRRSPIKFCRSGFQTSWTYLSHDVRSIDWCAWVADTLDCRRDVNLAPFTALQDKAILARREIHVRVLGLI